MVARVWSGRTAAGRAEEYAAYLRETGVREVRGTTGNRGVILLRRVEGEVAEFVFVSLWGSMEDVTRFAGPDPERAVYYPRDREFLLELAPHVRHYEVVEQGA